MKKLLLLPILLLLGQCTEHYVVKAKVGTAPIPVMLGPIERIGGHPVNKDKKIRKAKSLVRVGSVANSCGQNCTEIYHYDDSPEVFGKNLLEKLPGTNVKLHLDFVKTSSTAPCQLLLFCTRRLAQINGKGASYAK